MERLLSERDSKGLSLRALSDRSGIPVGTLSWWSHKLRDERGLAPEDELDHAEQALLDRFAIGKALTETQILTIRRRD